jgi:hypothetical protein
MQSAEIVRLLAGAVPSVARTVCSQPNCTNAACRSKRSRTHSCLAAVRRIIRPDGAAPLGTIRSLAYFASVIEEVLQLQAGPEYFQYLRYKRQRAA